MGEIETKLDQLSELMSQRDVLGIDKANMRKEIIPNEILQKLEDLDLEYAAKTEAIEAKIAEFQASIKSQVLSMGESVKGQRLQAVFMKPRVTWDTKAIDGYALAHPELFAFRKEGEPSVQIRMVNK